MITDEMMKQAIKTSHNPCCGGDCIHAEAVASNTDEIDIEILRAVLNSIKDNLSADMIFLRIWLLGLHAGYRLYQLEHDKIPGVAHE